MVDFGGTSHPRTDSPKEDVFIVNRFGKAEGFDDGFHILLNLTEGSGKKKQCRNIVVVSTSVDNPFRHAQNSLAQMYHLTSSAHCGHTSKTRLERIVGFFSDSRIQASEA